MSSTSDQVRLVSIIAQMGLHGPRRKAQAFMLVGKPGVAKTVGMHAVADMVAARLKKPFPAEVWSGPQIQAEDAAGLPVPDLETGTTRLLPLRLGEEVMSAGRGLLCIDEFGSITNSQEAAFLNLLQGGRLGERILPPEVALGAMMNPDDIASNGRGLSAPAANRFIWINWDLQVGTWLDYMRGGRGLAAHVEVLPEDWEDKFGNRTRGIIASYIQRNPDALLRMPPPHDAGKAWASPRSWETAARVMAACLAIGERQTSDLVSLAIEGCVGEGDTESFISWLVDMALPDPEELLKDPKNAHKLIPDRNDQRAVTMEALATAATDKEHKDFKERWEAAWAVLGPVFTKQNDVALGGAKILAKNIPPGTVEYPPEAKQIPKILKQAGLAS